jgi:hypothetical protein
MWTIMIMIHLSQVGQGLSNIHLWNALQNGEDLDEFFARIYKQSRSRWSRRERTTVKDTTDLHNYIPFLPGAEEFPLWRIGCM